VKVDEECVVRSFLDVLRPKGSRELSPGLRPKADALCPQALEPISPSWKEK